MFNNPRDHSSNIPRDRNNSSNIPIRDNYYNNAHTPANFVENLQERCLFTNNNDSFNKVTQNNDINYDNSNQSNNRGNFLYEQNYTNRPLLDNNMYDEIRNEFIDEKDIIIDTIDRDISRYPNVFNFTVKLGSTDSTPGPSIHRSVKNVKYIKLVKTIFPDNYYIKKIENTNTNLKNCINNFINNNFNDLNTNINQYDNFYTDSNETIYIIYYYTYESIFTIDYYRSINESPDYTNVYSAVVETAELTNDNIINTHSLYTKDKDCQVGNGRFFQLHIDQLPKNNDLATNSNISKSFSLLYPGRENSRGFNNMDGMETDKIFRFSNLGNFSSMSITILDSAGDLLKNNSDIWNMNLDNVNNASNIININSISKEEYRNSFRSASKYLRHPLAWNMQAQFIFNIGEVQIEMNKKTFN